jgi:hypothetical protein
MIQNSGFETGNLSGWEAVGDVSIQTASFGTPPKQGSYHAVLTTFESKYGKPPLSGVATVFSKDIETFLGLPDVGGNIPHYYFLDALSKDRREGGAHAPFPAATDGSAIKQQIRAHAGSKVTIYYNFLTDGGWGNANDFAFVSLISGKVLLGFIIAGVESPHTPSSTVLTNETGYLQFTFNIPFADTYTLCIGVLQMRDEMTPSALCIDKVTVS